MRGINLWILLCLALAGAPPAQGEEDTASSRLDALSKTWWGDQQSGTTSRPVPPADHALTLLDGERADETTWLGLTLILGLVPADRWHVANGQTVVQRDPSDEEKEVLADLGPRVGLKHPKSFEVRTEAGSIVWLGLSSANATVDVPLAWPIGWRTVEAARAMRQAGWAAPALPPSGLVDPSFEDPIAVRVAWWTDGVSVADTARTALGAHSIRLEGDTDFYQRVAVQPGVELTVRAKLAAQGSEVTPALDFEDDAGKVIATETGTTVRDQAWQELSLVGTAPASASAVVVRFRSRGAGFANVDDVRFTRSDVAAATGPQRIVRAWPGTAIRLLADPAQVPDAQTHLTHIDQAVRGALGLLGQPTASVVDVRFAPSAGGAGAGQCAASTDADAVTCVLRQDLEALWGKPANDLFAAAFTRALSGANLPPQQGSLEDGLQWTDGPPPAAWVSFSRWLLDQYGTAAVRAAWQSADLRTFRAGKKALPELEAAWQQ